MPFFPSGLAADPSDACPQPICLTLHEDRIKRQAGQTEVSAVSLVNKLRLLSSQGQALALRELTAQNIMNLWPGQMT